ncbi:MAG: hypothetical protein AAF467_26290 [Actinomycetota bacterium]
MIETYLWALRRSFVLHAILFGVALVVGAILWELAISGFIERAEEYVARTGDYDFYEISNREVALAGVLVLMLATFVSMMLVALVVTLLVEVIERRQESPGSPLRRMPAPPPESTMTST